MKDPVEEISLGTEIIVVVHDREISLTELLGNWVESYNLPSERRTKQIESKKFYTQKGRHKEDDNWANILIESGNRLRVTRYDGGHEEFKRVESHTRSLQDKLTEKRIPYSVQFHEIRKPITDYPLKWIQTQFSDGWDLMRQRFIYGYVSSDFSYFSIKHDDGEKLSLSKDGFHYTKEGVINSTKAEIDPVSGIVESENPGAINLIQIGIVDKGEQPMKFIKYHFTTMFGLFQYFPAGKIREARDGYKNLFSEQLFAANHLPRDEKSQIYLEFNEIFKKATV